jgi:hypothetical protein
VGCQVYESLIQEVCGLDRRAVIERLSRFSGNLRLDFTPEFLAEYDTEHLRHLLLAALWRCRMKEATGSNPLPVNRWWGENL